MPKKLWGMKEWNPGSIFRVEWRRSDNIHGTGIWFRIAPPLSDPILDLVNTVLTEGEEKHKGCFILTGEKVHQYYDKNKQPKHFGKSKDISVIVWHLKDSLPENVLTVYRHFTELYNAEKVHKLGNELIEKAKELQKVLPEISGSIEEFVKMVEGYESIKETLGKIDNDILEMPFFGRQHIDSNSIREKLFADYKGEIEFSDLFFSGKSIVDSIRSRVGKSPSHDWVSLLDKRLIPSFQQLAKETKLSNPPEKKLERLFISELVGIFDSYADLWILEFGNKYRTKRWKFAKTCFEMFFEFEKDKLFSIRYWQRKIKEISIPTHLENMM